MYTFTDICAHDSMIPKQVKNYDNATYRFWERSLYERAAYSLDFTLVDDWEKADLKPLFMMMVFRKGFLGVMDTKDFGLAFQHGALSGYDFYYRPTKFILSNPMLSGEYTIGKDCEIVKLTPEYLGIWDIIEYYATKLAQLSLSVDMSIINTRFAKIFAARNKAAAETLKKIVDKINRGEPAVITDDKLTDDRTDKAAPFQEFGIEHLKENYITDLQLRDIQTLLNMFDTEIGIPTIPYQKQERLVVSEAESKQTESEARITTWIECLNSSFERVNSMFGTNMSVKVRNSAERGILDVTGNIDNHSNV